MSVRIITADFLALLDDLIPTAAPEQGVAGYAGILFHSDRVEEGSDPGKTNVLVGTSINGISVGHAWTEAGGTLPPTAFPIQYCHALKVSLKKLLTKDNRETHVTEISRDGDLVVIQEDPDLFGNGFKQSFEQGKLSDFPHRTAFGVLGEVHVTPSEHRGPRTPRVDFSAAEMAKFAAIAARHGGTIEVFVAHQRMPVHIQIGWRYRGIIIPASWSDEMSDGVEPSIGVYPCDLPDPEPGDTPDLRTATGVFVSSTAGRDE
ncbi:hypothetical protein ACFXGA_05825 [Actinosynnema sp. NPDC059335]|uniref:hypothetical protein n=1 Tax=Actinosynnema sp. NPDC059335 TaxID=3346804 RepID=UPI00366FE623